MMKTVVSENIHAPIERVFEVATDLANAAETIRGIDSVEILTDGPVGVGTRWRETRTMFGRTATEVMEITAYAPPEGKPEAGYVAEATSHGCLYITPVTLIAEGPETTRISVEFQAHPQTLISKIMIKLMGNKLKSMVEEPLADDLRDIKRAAESPADE